MSCTSSRAYPVAAYPLARHGAGSNRSVVRHLQPALSLQAAGAGRERRSVARPSLRQALPRLVERAAGFGFDAHLKVAYISQFSSWALLTSAPIIEIPLSFRITSCTLERHGDPGCCPP